MVYLLTLALFTGPMELLGFLAKGSMVQTSASWPFSPYEFIIDYVAETIDPVVPGIGPALVPTKTFAQVNNTQYDLILVPGGTCHLSSPIFGWLRFNTLIRPGFTSSLYLPCCARICEKADARAPVPTLRLYW
jgi:hypothetical protein